MENTKDSNKLVDTVIDQKEVIVSYSRDIDVLNRELGAKEAHIETLKEQIADLKSKEPQIRVIKGKQVETWFGNIQSEDTLEYRNLDSVKMDIEKVTENKYKAKLEKLEKDLKSAKSDLEDSNEKIERVRKSYESETLNIRQNYSLKEDELKRNNKELSAKKDLRIKELEEEITKVKEDKTDEQLEKLRTEEIDLLKKQIDAFTNLNVFKRIFYAITGNITAAVAEVELQKNKKEQEQLKRYSYPGIGSNLFSLYW